MSEGDKNPYTVSTKEDEEEDDLHLTGCNALPCCDPRRAGHRFTVLIFLCFLSFGELNMFLILQSFRNFYKNFVLKMIF